MNTELRVHIDQEMHVIRHHFQFFDLCLMLCTHRGNNLFQACFNRPHKYLPSVFRTPDHMIVARKKDVPIVSILLNHSSSIQHRDIYCQGPKSRRCCPSSPTPKKGTRPSSPWMNNRGFRARYWVTSASAHTYACFSRAICPAITGVVSIPLFSDNTPGCTMHGMEVEERGDCRFEASATCRIMPPA